MRLATTMMMCGALALTATACGQKTEEADAPAKAAPKVVETPKRKPGLWIQTTSVEGLGEVPPISLCLDEETDSKMAWWGQQGVRGGCLKNDVTRNADGSWSFESICQSQANISTTTRGTATGDFESAFKVEAETTTEGAPIPDMNGTRKVSIDYRWEGECPAEMSPGDMKLPDGSMMNALKAMGGQ